ncbi:MAG: response regulator [Erysipelothrix sp.]|nr:response regulator [Erysipelothrix sp.]
MRLVIIDDEMWSREVVKKLIHFEKFNLELVGEADNGLDGLKLIENLKPDIVITDMKMPGLDGLQVLKKLSKYPHIKTIVMSGFDDYDYLRQAIHSKAIEYLLKPIKEEDVNAAIERCINELSLVNEKVLTSNRIFTDEHDHLDYLSIIKRLQLAIIKKNSNKMNEVLSEVSTFKKQLSSTELIKKLKDNLLDQLQQYLHQQNIDYSLNTPNLVFQSLEEMIQQINPIFDRVINDITIPKDRTSLDIIDIKQFIDQHYMYPISLDDVAETFYVSKEHVSRLFSKKYQQSVTQYILKKKMDHAADLISTSQLNYREIAFITGFEDISYFYKQFKKHFQCTPGEYKSNH